MEEAANGVGRTLLFFEVVLEEVACRPRLGRLDDVLNEILSQYRFSAPSISRDPEGFTFGALEPAAKEFVSHKPLASAEDTMKVSIFPVCLRHCLESAQ